MGKTVITFLGLLVGLTLLLGPSRTKGFDISGLTPTPEPPVEYAGTIPEIQRYKVYLPYMQR